MADILSERRINDEKLAMELEAFGLLGRSNVLAPVKPVPSSKPVYPEVSRRSYCNTGARPAHELCSMKPVYLEGEGFKGWVFQNEEGKFRFSPVRSTRTGFFGKEPDRFPYLPVFSRQSERINPRTGFLETEPARVRFVPVRPNFCPERKSGGTGVFLPRVTVKDYEAHKRYNVKGWEQKKQLNYNQKVGPTNIEGTERREPKDQPDTDLRFGLPREWIY